VVRLIESHLTFPMLCPGEDGQVFHFDLRTRRKNHLLTLQGRRGATAIYAMAGEYGTRRAVRRDPVRLSPWNPPTPALEEACEARVVGRSGLTSCDCDARCVAVNPWAPVYFVVGGTTTDVHLFDSRKSDCGPAARFAPTHLRGAGLEHVTGLAYDWCGREVVASYNDEHIYRFSVAEDAIPEGGGDGEDGAEDEEDEEEARGNGKGPLTTSAAGAVGRAAGAERGEGTGGEDGEEGEGGREGVKPAGACRGQKSLGYRCQYTGHRNDRTVKQASHVKGEQCSGLLVTLDGRTRATLCMIV
jgi:hypothetical protein